MNDQRKRKRKMLLARVIVTLIACYVVKADLLDLYVQHMDETMRTMLYRNRRHPMNHVSKRIKRSENVETELRVGNFKQQRLDAAEDWYKKHATKERIITGIFIPYGNDALDYPNQREENLSPDQYEILLNAMDEKLSKLSEETTVVFKDSIVDIKKNRRVSVNETVRSIPNQKKDEVESNTSRDPTIQEHKETFEDEILIVDNRTNADKLGVESLEPDEKILAEDSRETVEKERDNEEYSQFEIINTNERINLQLFDDPSFKKKLSGSRVPKKYLPFFLEKPAKDTREEKSQVKTETMNDRLKRSAKDLNFTRYERIFSRYEKLDEDGNVILEWNFSDDEEVTFRVTARTLGYVGIGFNERSNQMKGADILLAWVDDHTGVVNLLDSHGMKEMNAAPVTDNSQDVRVLDGSQNETHTTVTFARNWETCDPQDHRLTEGTIRVLWALHQNDPELNTPVWHGDKRGGKALRLKAAAGHSPPRETRDVHHWDVKLNKFEISDNKDTVYWCKIFKAPPAVSKKKHHMIGYTPIIEKANEDLVHHVILYECASTDPILGEHARLVGTDCYSQTMPAIWESCLQPVLAWARGSEGEWLPEHVGMPIAEHHNKSYYMLEVHYNNPDMKKVIDSSGVRLHLTPKLRSQEAGILVTGVAVNSLYMVPPEQKEYATAGYCTPHCTNTMFPQNGINVVSVVLHSHSAGRRLSLKHIRQGKELPKIVQDNHFDFDYQQSHTLEKEVNVLPGDELVAECIYGTLDRTKPTLGGYAASQETCLAFITHYPRTPLAGCFSMTPIKDLFKTLNVNSFQGITMDELEKHTMKYLTTRTNSLQSWINRQFSSYSATRATDEVANSTLMKNHTEERESDNIFTRLIIKEPSEFKGLTVTKHIMALPWNDELFARSVEKNLYHGRHVTFCRKRDETLALPADIQNFPNYTALPESNDTSCSYLKSASGSSNVPQISYIFVINLISIISIMIVF